MRNPVLFSIIGIICIMALVAASAPPDPSNAVLDIQVTPPKKTGKLEFKFRTKGKNKLWNDEGGTEVVVNLSEGMTSEEKAEAIVDALNDSITVGFDFSSTGGSVHAQPKPGNEDIGRMVIPKPKDKTEEGFKVMDTPDFSISGLPAGVSPAPLEFFVSLPPNPSIIDYEDWIIFEIEGTPAGFSSTGSPGYVGVSSNDLQIAVPSSGLSMDQILDFIVAETAIYPDLQGFADYGTGRVLILSEDLVTLAGVISQDSGLDIGWTMMDN